MNEFVIRLGLINNEEYLIVSESEKSCFEGCIKVLLEDGYTICGFKLSHSGDSHDDFSQTYVGVINGGGPFADTLRNAIDEEVDECYEYPADAKYYEELTDDVINRWATLFYFEKDCSIFAFKKDWRDEIIKNIFYAKIEEIEPFSKMSYINRKEWREHNNIDFVSVYLH